MKDVLRFDLGTMLGKWLCRVRPDVDGAYVEYESFKNAVMVLERRVGALKNALSQQEKRAQEAEREVEWLLDEFYRTGCPSRRLIRCGELGAKNCLACHREALRRAMAVCGTNAGGKRG